MLPIEVEEAISDKIDVLLELCVIKPDNVDAVRSDIRYKILAEPNRDPYVIMDQIAHTYINEAWN